MKISPWYVRLAPTQGFLLSLCAKAFASAVTLLQDFLCLFTRLSSAYPPFAFVLCSSSPRSPILGGLGSLNRIICVTWRILINWYYPFFPLVRFTYSLTLQAAPYGIWRARSTLALAPRVSLHARFRACFVTSEVQSPSEDRSRHEHTSPLPFLACEPWAGFPARRACVVGFPISHEARRLPTVSFG